MIPSSRPGEVIFAHGKVAYEHRKHITRCFGRMKHVRRFATRYERRIAHF